MKISSAASFLACLYYRSVAVPVFAAPIYANNTEISVTANGTANYGFCASRKDLVHQHDVIRTSVEDWLKMLDDDDDAILKAKLEESVITFNDSKKQALEAIDKSCEPRLPQDATVIVSASPDTKQAEFCGDTTTVMKAFAASVKAANIALDVLDDAYRGLEDASHIAAWAALVIFAGAGVGLPSSAAYGVASTPKVAAVIGLIAGRSAVFVAEEAIIELDGQSDRCLYLTSRVIHDVSFEGFEKLELVEEELSEVNVLLQVVDGKTDAIGALLQVVDGKTDAIGALLQVIDGKADDITLFVRHLTCPYSKDQQQNFVEIGGGCDGEDNDCDSTIIGAPPLVSRVDECDEDKVPPSIVLKKDPPIFASTAEAEKWYLANTETSDDCAAVLEKEILSVTSVQAGSKVIWSIKMRVFDPRCDTQIEERALINGEVIVVDGPGSSSAEKTFAFRVDGAAPTVICGFDKPQDINHVLDATFVPDGTTIPPFPAGSRTDPLHIDYVNEQKNLVDVKLWYTITETQASDFDEKIQVDITVTSNEFEHDGNEMHKFIIRRDIGTSPLPVHRTKLYLAPFSCQPRKKSKKSKDSNTKNICEVEDPPSLFTTRIYDIEIAATDTTGNVGKITCTVVVVPQDHYKGSKVRKGETHITRGDLINEVGNSVQRYEIGTHTDQWDPTLDTTRVAPLLIRRKRRTSAAVNRKSKS